MGGPALRCAAGKSNRARCFQRVALSTAPFFLRRDFRARCASREPLKQLRRELFVRASGERFARRAFVRHHSRAAASNGASVRKSGRRTPSARASRVARTAPSRATFARHCRRSCRRRLPATPRPASTVAAACALGVLAGGGELQLEDPRQPAGRPATPRPTSTVAAACALGVLAGGGELQLEDPRPWSTRGAAEPASALAASLARPLPLRAWGALPTWGSMITRKNTSHPALVELLL